MSNTPRAAEPPVPVYADPGKRKTSKADWLPFQLGDVLYHMVMPKQYDIGQIMMVLDSGRPVDDPENLAVLMHFAARITRYIVAVPPDADGTLRGRARIEERLRDPEDRLDLQNLVPILADLMKGWVARPTGSPPASSVAVRRRAPAGRVSRAHTQSARAKT